MSPTLCTGVSSPILGTPHLKKEQHYLRTLPPTSPLHITLMCLCAGTKNAMSGGNTHLGFALPMVRTLNWYYLITVNPFSHIDKTPSAGVTPGSTCVLQASTLFPPLRAPPSPARTEGLGVGGSRAEAVL